MSELSKELEKINAGTRVLCLLVVLQDQIDAMEYHDFKLKHIDKKRANQFRESIDRQLKEFYKEMPTDGQVVFHQQINNFTDIVNQAIKRVEL